MRIIEPDYEILDDYFKQGRLLEQIERCGRVCYKSEDRISEQSAIPFIKGIIGRGHESVIEMGQIVLEVKSAHAAVFNDFFEIIPRFNVASRLDDGHYIISGNPRSFRDLARQHGEKPLVRAMVVSLSTRYPVLYEDVVQGISAPDGIEVEALPAAKIDALPQRLLLKHRTLLVHITVNRAVTHELVRHRVASYLQESQRYCRYGEPRFGGGVTFIRPCFYDEGSIEYITWQESMERAERDYLKLLATSSPQAARTVLPNSCKTEIMVHATLEEWVHILRLRTSKAADPSMREIMLKMLPGFVEHFPGIFEAVAKGIDD